MMQMTHLECDKWQLPFLIENIATHKGGGSQPMYTNQF